jgi:hypothetical protein
MRKPVWIAAGVVVATVLTAVVNLLTSGGAWWLWPILVLLVVAAIVVAVVQERRSSSPPTHSQEIEARGKAALVEDSSQLDEGSNGTTVQKITARRKGIVRRSPQTTKRR